MTRPLEIGKKVRTRHTATDQNKWCGKKLADLKSKRFIVLERHNNTPTGKPSYRTGKTTAF